MRGAVKQGEGTMISALLRLVAAAGVLLLVAMAGTGIPRT
jgi:hypothetical protein